MIKRWANGEDQSPVNQVEIALPIKSIGHSTTTIVDVKDYTTAKQVITFLADMISVRLRQGGLVCRGISVNIRYNNLTSISKQTTLEYQTFDGGTIAKSAYNLLLTMWQGTKDIPLRLIGISTHELSAVAQDTQESLFKLSDSEDLNSLNFTIDKIRKKYGYTIIQKATTINNNVMTDKSPIEDTEFIPFKKLN